jgi:hypothetical protein
VAPGPRFAVERLLVTADPGALATWVSLLHALVDNIGTGGSGGSDRNKDIKQIPEAGNNGTLLLLCMLFSPIILGLCW